MTGGFATPSQIDSSPKSAKLGTVRIVLVIAMMIVDRGSDRAATIPSPSPIPLVIAMHSPTISRWVAVCGPIRPQLSAMYWKTLTFVRRQYPYPPGVTLGVGVEPEDVVAPVAF